MNKILQDYHRHWRWAERTSVLLMTRKLIAGIIACCPDEKIEQVAKRSGSTNTKDMLRVMGINPTYDTIKLFIKKNLGESAKWFDYSNHTRGNKEIIHLRHELGRKWSYFISIQVSTMFESLLKVQTKTEVHDDFATIEIPL